MSSHCIARLPLEGASTRKAESTPWRQEAPTPDNHHAFHTPPVNWKEDRTTWNWPSGKFDYPTPDVLWTTLHAEFNCMPLAIQDPYAWHADVRELSLASDTKEEFEAALRRRREDRFKEIRANWDKTKSQLVANPIIWRVQPKGRDLQWTTFTRISRHFSFDAIMGHFGNITVPNPDILYLKEREEREAEAAAVGLASSSASRAIEAPPEQPGRTRQSTQHLADSQSPRPSPSPTGKTRHNKIIRTRKGPARHSRVEKPPPRQRNARAKPREGVRRSARLQERAGRGSG
ncbi:hypothetical protein GGR58DRAFT_494831 [Xylaria digitata]|nr:hypothetical protein GGR58DRAFT_494831 [Xylaria digitata]